MPISEGNSTYPQDSAGRYGIGGLLNNLFYFFRFTAGKALGIDFLKGTVNITAVAPTNVSGTLLAANTSRRSALFVNNGTVTVFIQNVNPATTTVGIPLFPGSAYEDNRGTDAWYAITASGTGDVRVAEAT